MRAKALNARRQKVGAVCLIAIGFVLLGFAAFQAMRISSFIQNARSAAGTVTALKAERGMESSFTYAPVFSFHTADGKVISITSKASSNPPSFKVGDNVRVLYPPGNPAGAKIDSPFQLWGLPILLGCTGILLFVIAAAVFFVLRILMRNSIAF